MFEIYFYSLFYITAYYTNSYNGFISNSLLTVFLYLILTFNIFSVILLFDSKKIKSLNAFKLINTPIFTSTTTLIIILSLAGLPPLLGFLPKFFIFNYLIKFSNFFLIFFLTVLNFMMTYFYIQNLRLLVSKKNTNIFIIRQHNVVINKNILSLIVFFTFINICGIFLINEFSLCFIYCTTTLLFI